MMTITVSYYFYLGLFEVHKLLFSFQMTIRIQEEEEGLNRDQLDFFIKGNISLEKVVIMYSTMYTTIRISNTCISGILF